MTTTEPRPRVLIIDDDELICGSLRHYLTAQGFAVDAALEPDAAHLLLAANRYAVVVVDPYLTAGVRGDGTDLLHRASALQSDASIIVLTAYGSPMLEIAAKKCNVTALLTKPKSVVFVEQVIRSAASRTASANRAMA